MVCLPIPPRRRSGRILPAFRKAASADAADRHRQAAACAAFLLGNVGRAIGRWRRPGAGGRWCRTFLRRGGRGNLARTAGRRRCSSRRRRGCVLADRTHDAAVVAVYARSIVARKKIAASTAVERERKLADPLAPNRLPEAPPPKAAPMSAPLPCCSKINTMMEIAQIT